MYGCETNSNDMSTSSMYIYLITPWINQTGKLPIWRAFSYNVGVSLYIYNTCGYNNDCTNGMLAQNQHFLKRHCLFDTHDYSDLKQNTMHMYITLIKVNLTLIHK